MIVGIDLGTTHSLVGIWKDGAAELVPNSLGQLMTPSVVGVDDAGEVLVGAAARERLLTHPQLTVATFKRHMGSQREVQLGRRRFRPEELSALVLKSLLDDIEAHRGHRPEEAVISVPAYFSDAQRKATRAAGELAGIRVERLINEPTAAALAYGLQQRDAESRFLVIDLGGGTFDVSILELFEGVMEVHASAGDNFLGGEDFVDLLAGACLQAHDIDFATLDPAAQAHVRGRIEQAKRTLSISDHADLVLKLGERELAWRVSHAEFEELAAPLLARMRQPIERALRDAGIGRDDLDEIIMVGGASRMPMVTRLVTRLFGRLPLRHVNPDEAIALGATVMAALKARDHSLDEVIMTDVCPYTLGVETAHRDSDGMVTHGQFSPIIERNTIVPASREQTYYPMQDNQQLLNLRVFQGESPRVQANVFLGELRVKLPRAAVDKNPVRVRFTYDVNGLLEVEATVAATGHTHQLVIEQNPGLLDAAQIAERLQALAELKVHPREAQANRAVIARAERLYEERLGAARQQIGEWLAAFRGELERQDPERIRHARQRMQDLLDAAERESPW